MRNVVVVVVALCIQTVLNTVAAVNPNDINLSDMDAPYLYDSEFSKNSPFRILSDGQSFKVQGPLVDRGLTCEELDSQLHVKNVNPILIPCKNNVQPYNVESSSIEGISYYNGFSPKVAITWTKGEKTRIYFDIDNALTLLWTEGYYLRDSIANCFVPFRSRGLSSSHAAGFRAAMLLFPHCVAKIPEHSLKGFSGLQVFKTFYYKTLLELNGFFQKGWFDYLAEDGHKPELEKLRKEYSEHAKQKLTLDNYKMWLLLPLRIRRTFEDHTNILRRENLKYRSIHTIFDTEALKDGVLNAMQLAFGRAVVLSDDDMDSSFAFYDNENCYSHFNLPGSYSKYHPLFLNLVMKPKIRPMNTDIDGSRLFHLYKCVVAIEEAGFFASLPLTLTELEAKANFPLEFNIGPSVLSLQKEGPNSTDLLYSSLHKIVRQVFYYNISSHPDKVNMLRSLLRDDQLIDCYENRKCDGIHVLNFPDNECQEEYRDTNGDSHPIEQNIVDVCRASINSGNDIMQVWTTIAESASIQQELSQKGLSFTVLNVTMGDYEAQVISTSDKFSPLGLTHHFHGEDDERNSVMNELRQQTELHQLLAPFCKTKVLQFAGIQRFVCVSTLVDERVIQYGDGNLSDLVKDVALPLIMVHGVLDFPRLLKINETNLALAIEDLESLLKHYDLSAFNTAESTLAELEKERTEMSPTLDILWRLRRMYTERTPGWKTYIHRGKVQFNFESPRFSQAISLFHYGDINGVQFLIYDCEEDDHESFGSVIQCKSLASGFPRNMIRKSSKTEEDMRNDLYRFADLSSTLWQETNKVLSIRDNRHTIEYSWSKKDFYSKMVLSELFDARFEGFRDKLNMDELVRSMQPNGLELTVEESLLPVLDLINDRSGSNSEAKSFASYVNLLLSDKLFKIDGPEEPSLTLRFWYFESMDGLLLLKLLEIVAKYQLGSVEYVPYKKTPYIRLTVSNEYKRFSRMVATSRLVSKNLAAAMQLVQLDKLLQLYIPEYSIATCDNGMHLFAPHSHIYGAISRDTDPCFTGHSSANTDTTEKDRGFALLSTIAKTVFPTHRSLLNSHKNVQKVVKGLGIGDIMDKSQTSSSALLDGIKSVELWKSLALFSENENFVISSTYNDDSIYDTTRKGFITNVLDLSHLLYWHGIVVRVCPGQGKSRFSINFFKPEDSDDVRDYFENSCQTDIVPPKSQFGGRLKRKNPMRRISKVPGFIGGSPTFSSTGRAPYSKKFSQWLKTIQSDPVGDLFDKSSIVDGKDSVSSSYEKLGDIEDYVLQSIGFIASYLGPNRKSPLQVFDAAELDEFKTKIGYPSDGSIKVSDLLNAIDEVESLNVGRRHPYDDEFPDVPETLSPAGKVMYNILYKLDMERCPICISDIYVVEDNQATLGSCGHMYHTECSSGTNVEWKCAVCKATRPFDR